MPLAPSEQIKKIDNEINQLKTRKQAILNKEKQKQKKERTSRLIKYGELVEKYWECEGVPANEFEEYLKHFTRLIENGSLAEKYLNCEGMSPEKFVEILKVVIRKLKNMS